MLWWFQVAMIIVLFVRSSFVLSASQCRRYFTAGKMLDTRWSQARVTNSWLSNMLVTRHSGSLSDYHIYRRNDWLSPLDHHVIITWPAGDHHLINVWATLILTRPSSPEQRVTIILWASRDHHFHLLSNAWPTFSIYDKQATNHPSLLQHSSVS